MDRSRQSALVIAVAIALSVAGCIGATPVPSSDTGPSYPAPSALPLPSATPAPSPSPEISAAPAPTPQVPSLGALLRRTREMSCVAEVSTDNALSWQPIPAPSEDCRTVFMTADAAVFAYELLFTGDDMNPTITSQLRQAEGNGWSEPRSLPVDGADGLTFLGGNGVIYMAAKSDSDSTIWRSLDQGRSWESIYGPIEGYVELVATNVLGADLFATLPLVGQTLLFKVEAEGWGWSAGSDYMCPTGRDTSIVAGEDFAYSVTTALEGMTFCRSTDGLRWAPVSADDLPRSMAYVDALVWSMRRHPVIFLDHGNALTVSPSLTRPQLDGLSFVPGDLNQSRITLSSDPTWLEYELPR